MPAIETTVIFVHGANQGGQDERKNRQTWEEAFAVEEDNSQKLLPVLEGGKNGEIQTYHERRGGSQYPAYGHRDYAWYGDVYQEAEAAGFGEALNESREEDSDDQDGLLDKIERKTMKRHFDELVPFYELKTVGGSGRTLYELICTRLVDKIAEGMRSGRKGLVLVGHSMGCAVSYNVLTHLSLASEGKPLTAVAGALSDAYANRLDELRELETLGLMTFGNYTAYNWCQRLNNRILHGTPRKQFVYPSRLGRWRNFWTMHNSDPYIIDDQLENSMIEEEEDKFDDIRVWTVPFRNIGHGRANWFARDSFVKKLANQMSRHVYI